MRGTLASLSAGISKTGGDGIVEFLLPSDTDGGEKLGGGSFKGVTPPEASGVEKVRKNRQPSLLKSKKVFSCSQAVILFSCCTRWLRLSGLTCACTISTQLTISMSTNVISKVVFILF